MMEQEDQGSAGLTQASILTQRQQEYPCRSFPLLQEFPSDEQMASMTRKDRIAMMQQEGYKTAAPIQASVLGQRKQQLQDFPSDEQMASMTRKERIAMIEREEQEIAAPQAPARYQQQPQEFPPEESMANRERIAMMERVEPWMLEEGAAPVPAGQKPPQELPSDEQFASMSRKERIAMMEREEQAKARKPSSSNSYDLASDEPE